MQIHIASQKAEFFGFALTLKHSLIGDTHEGAEIHQVDEHRFKGMICPKHHSCDSKVKPTKYYRQVEKI